MERVIIAGAGPVGLWLAGELRLAGVQALVLEREMRRSPHSKALTVHPRSLEVLAMRGLADRLLEEGLRIPNGSPGSCSPCCDPLTPPDRTPSHERTAG